MGFSGGVVLKRQELENRLNSGAAAMDSMRKIMCFFSTEHVNICPVNTQSDNEHDVELLMKSLAAN